MPVIFLVVPIVEELYRSAVVDSLRSSYFERDDIVEYLKEFKSKSVMVPVYIAPGVILSNCDDPKELEFGGLGCFSWDKFGGVSSVATDSDRATFQNDTILSRDCSSNDCKFDQKYHAYISHPDRTEALALFSNTKTVNSCSASIQAGWVLKYNVQYCRTETSYNEVPVRVSFEVLVDQPYYARFFSDVWFRNELNFMIDFGRRRIEFLGRETSDTSVEAQ